MIERPLLRGEGGACTWCQGVNVSSSAGWHWVRWAQISRTPVLRSLGHIWTRDGLERQLARTPWASGPSLKSLLANSPEHCQQVGIVPSLDPSASGWALPFQAALRLRLKGRRRHAFISILFLTLPLQYFPAGKVKPWAGRIWLPARQRRRRGRCARPEAGDARCQLLFKIHLVSKLRRGFCTNTWHRWAGKRF